jgi:hypothetical protein
MSRLRRIGLAVTFALTLSGGVLMSQPAHAITLNEFQCARLQSLAAYLSGLAAKHPDNQFLALIAQRAADVATQYCGG